MLTLTNREMSFIGTVLEGLLYGIYSGIFAMYLQYRASKKDTIQKQNIVFYSLCVLYVLSIALFVGDIAQPLFQYLNKPIDSVLSIALFQMTSFGCCDFIAQFILIYRCWIVWGCNIRVVIIPSILAFAFLVTWLAGDGSVYISSDEIFSPFWGYVMTLSGLALSLAVNALVTGLIVFRICKVFRRVGTTADDQILGITGGTKLRRTILVLIESGMALFSIQLIRVVASIVNTDAALGVFYIITPVHNMITGITPTIILVRTSMGLSFHDEKSMEEVAIGSLRFVADHQNSVSDTESIGAVAQDNREDDIGIQRSNDIDVVRR